MRHSLSLFVYIIYWELPIKLRHSHLDFIRTGQRSRIPMSILLFSYFTLFPLHWRYRREIHRSLCVKLNELCKLLYRKAHLRARSRATLDPFKLAVFGMDLSRVWIASFDQGASPSFEKLIYPTIYITFSSGRLLNPQKFSPHISTIYYAIVLLRKVRQITT